MLELNKEKISYNMNEEAVLGNVYFDIYNQTFNLVSDRKSLTFHGGCLIDEVGLGKTLDIITLGLANPATSTSYTKISCKDKFYSRATLVICPNQLCGQWIREFKDKINSSAEINVVSLMTKRDFDNMHH